MQALPRRKQTPPYTALAAGYDLVMDHVAYDLWATYTHGLLQEHHPSTQTILELGCGTGSLALELQPKGPYEYLATDGSAEMIRIARRKAELERAPIRFEVAEFTSFAVEEPVDAVVLLYDGLNYLLDEAALEALFRCAFRSVRPGGVFVVDQSTPANSENNSAFFEDAGRAKNFQYVRRSHYDERERLHTTTFELIVAGHHFYEEHVQRAYEMNEVRAAFRVAGWKEEAAYDGFSTTPATSSSERVHWVLRRPAEQKTAGST